MLVQGGGTFVPKRMDTLGRNFVAARPGDLVHGVEGQQP